MKTMTCKQLRGTCDEEFHAESVEEMVKLAQKHGMEMAEKGDEAHIKIMEAMKEKGSDPEAQKTWMEQTSKEFDALPEDE